MSNARLDAECDLLTKSERFSLKKVISEVFTCWLNYETVLKTSFFIFSIVYLFIKAFSSAIFYNRTLSTSAAAYYCAYFRANSLADAISASFRSYSSRSFLSCSSIILFLIIYVLSPKGLAGGIDESRSS